MKKRDNKHLDSVDNPPKKKKINYEEILKNEIVTLNFSNQQCFTTTKTLLEHSESPYFSNLFNEKYGEPLIDSNGHFYIDKDPNQFEHILHYLKSGYYKNIEKIDMDALNAEIDFYGFNIPKLKKIIVVYDDNMFDLSIESDKKNMLYFTPDFFRKTIKGRLKIQSSLFNLKLRMEGWSTYKTPHIKACYKICEDKNYTDKNLKEFINKLPYY